MIGREMWLTIVKVTSSLLIKLPLFSCQSSIKFQQLFFFFTCVKTVFKNAARCIWNFWHFFLHQLNFFLPRYLINLTKRGELSRDGHVLCFIIKFWRPPHDEVLARSKFLSKVWFVFNKYNCGIVMGQTNRLLHCREVHYNQIGMFSMFLGLIRFPSRSQFFRIDLLPTEKFKSL